MAELCVHTVSVPLVVLFHGRGLMAETGDWQEPTTGRQWLELKHKQAGAVDRQAGGQASKQASGQARWQKQLWQRDTKVRIAAQAIHTRKRDHWPNKTGRQTGVCHRSANLWFCSQVRRRAALDSFQILRWLCSTDGTAVLISWEGKRGMKCVMAVADEVRELWKDSTQVRWELHEAGLRSQMHLRAVPRSWDPFCLLDWGWWPEERLTVAPSDRQNSFHTWEVNWGPLSETMSKGIPWIRKMDDHQFGSLCSWG